MSPLLSALVQAAAPFAATLAFAAVVAGGSWMCEHVVLGREDRLIRDEAEADALLRQSDAAFAAELRRAD